MAAPKTTPLLERVGSAARALVPSLEDVLGVAGFCAVVYGVNMISVPAAWVVGGVLALVGAYLYARRS